jgi:ATP-binding cassette subfamily F protein uup
MLAQRGTPLPPVIAAAAPRPRPKAALAPKSTPPSPQAKRKLTFADRHALKTLPDRIAKLTAELHALETKLAAPDLYRKDPAAFTSATMALATARAELTAAEEEWLLAEMRREEVDGR